ncbi:hypothetical protein MIND_01114700 [Mycena indigotica]|uniref:Uncharacterized protein n=1 Tax=Mycena indigotica TaxID=2126181 RepID=A0A8H6S6V1_9AGAR|nr:uncharacterized protein MIND_01114700 [Mycena indigotica]KAF7293378.1 hypothetical protein MIND_01114700 [Mycena indigotica]
MPPLVTLLTRRQKSAILALLTSHPRRCDRQGAQVTGQSGSLGSGSPIVYARADLQTNLQSNSSTARTRCLHLLASTSAPQTTTPRRRAAAIRDSLPDAVSTAAANHNANGIFVPDAFVALYDQGRLPEGLITSAETTAIRCILPIVDNQEYVESIVDPGSQICAMSEALCHRLALQYDPTIVLQMQSANGAITPSLGVARNVAFTLRDIVLYLQVHIVRNPAYDVLLGRPFDVLTQSVVHNYSNNDQTITIRDPNTGRTATVPTIPRGSSRATKEGFLKLKSSRMKH